MSTECKNCKRNPAVEPTVILRRINHKGVVGEWICDQCLGIMETVAGKPHYVHSPTCPNYCDYACNGQAGFELAEQIAQHMEVWPKAGPPKRD